LVRALGKCFHPDTLIKLKNENVKKMKDICLGDVLENGSVVEATLKIDNKREPIPFHVIKNQGVNGEHIFVTGSHLVFDEKKQTFVKVEDYFKTGLSLIKSDYFSCLITNNHKIKIGNEIFWDWEDHFVKT